MRFQMLEIVREFVGELLPQNERAALERRHENYFVALAETGEREMRGAAQTAWLARLEREHDNFRAILKKRNAAPETAVRLAGALGRFWFARGYWGEGRDWLQKSLAAASPDSDNGNGENVLPRAKALLAAGTMAWVLDEYDEALRLAEQSLRDYRKQGDRVGMAYSLALLGRVTLLQGDNAGAADLLDESVAQFRGTADRWGLAHALDRRAFAARDAGAYEQAEALHSEGLDLRRALDDQQGLGLLHYIQDNDEQNTRHWYGTDSGPSEAPGVGNRYKWMDAIRPYVKSEQLFNCPSHTLPVTIGTSTFDRYKYRSGRNYGSYAANAAYFDDPKTSLSTSPFRNCAVPSWEAPATTVYAADSAGRYNINWPSGNPPILNGRPRYLYSPFQMVERHLGTVVILFCDGHAGAQRLEKLTKVGTSGRYSAFTVQTDPD